MSEPSFASLNPTLLARKGGAKPAMRPQFTNLPDAAEPSDLEDLGWNDMGQDNDLPDSGANIVQLKPSAANEDAMNMGEQSDDSAEPTVLRQRQKAADKIVTKAKASTKKKAKGQAANISAKTKPSSPRRAAFTLRLDADRHLKLRLASTMQGVSAQALVTEALDAMLEQIDDLDTLAAQMKRSN